MDVAAREAWLRLAMAPDIGPVLISRLIECFGDAAAVFAAPPDELRRVGGMGASRLEKLLDPGLRRAAAEEAQRAADGGIALLARGAAAYPELLGRLANPPPVLWVKGELEAADRLAVAIVGPRSASQYARLMTRRIAGPLATQGVAVVSGMAYGVDTEAHRAALESGGRTLAVLGQGLGTPVYPNSNRDLAEAIVGERRGALVSVFPMRTEPAPGLFPARNEVIAGLSLGTLIVEASTRSGALITARHAEEAGRAVMACPGDANRRAAQGSNKLIAEGATLVQTHDDVLAALGDELRREMEALGPNGDRSEPMTGDMGEDDRSLAVPGGPLAEAVVAMLREEPLPADVLTERLSAAGHGHGAIMEGLLQMELNGLLRQMPGRVYALTKG